eukprot:10176988-Prorocentrum_lima.AAC.1
MGKKSGVLGLSPAQVSSMVYSSRLGVSLPSFANSVDKPLGVTRQSKPASGSEVAPTMMRPSVLGT